MSGSTFDFHSQTGIAAMLLRVRQSDLSDEEKNELRDKIFTFVRSGGDQVLRSEIEVALNALPEPAARKRPIIAPVPKKEPAEKAGNTGGRETSAAPTAAIPDTLPTGQPVAARSASSFGQMRSVPRFAAPPLDAIVNAAPVVAPLPVTPTAPAPRTPTGPLLRRRIFVPQPAIPTNEPLATPTSPTTAAPEQATTASVSMPTVQVDETVKDVVDAPLSTDDISVVPDVTQKPIETTTPPPTPDVITTQPAPPIVGDPMERIKVIKAEVNAVFGNPVHLLAQNNTVGREYMTTLLAAIKAVNAGDATAIASSMVALERLKTTLLSTVATDGQVPAAATVQPATRMQSFAEVTEPPVHRTESATVTSPKPVTESPVLPVTPVRSVADRPAMPPPPVRPDVMPAPVAATPPPVNVKSSLYQTPAAPQPVPAAAARQAQSIPSAADQLLESETELAVKAAAAPKAPKAEAVADPLTTPEVTSGLEQLLSEWTLFKSSGIFGTGPSGREHPLYLQLAGLPMAAIISGRFEGATKEIRQSISDYMNGWRYEQGIVHDNTETFEHFLRRVIRHILDKLKA